MNKQENYIFKKTLDKNIKNISSKLSLPSQDNIEQIENNKMLDTEWLGCKKFINTDNSKIKITIRTKFFIIK